MHAYHILPILSLALAACVAPTPTGGPTTAAPCYDVDKVEACHLTAPTLAPYCYPEGEEGPEPFPEHRGGCVALPEAGAITAAPGSAWWDWWCCVPNDGGVPVSIDPGEPPTGH
jgi:hypothetical protein